MRDRLEGYFKFRRCLHIKCVGGSSAEMNIKDAVLLIVRIQYNKGVPSTIERIREKRIPNPKT